MERAQPPADAGRLRRVLNVASWGLLAVWCLWWGASLARGELIGVEYGWFPGCFGVDFVWHVDRPARIWLSGGDAYEDTVRMFLYPPLVTRIFSWVGLTTPERALTIWIGVVGIMAASCALVAWRCRRNLEIDTIPPTAIVAAMLFSTPLVFAMERGQYDLIIAPIVLASLAIMRRRSRVSQWVGGAVLALAPWAKVYPGLLGIGLAGLRRWEALVSFVIAGLVIGAAWADETARFLGNLRVHSSLTRGLLESEAGAVIHPWNHSLPDCWPRMWRGTKLDFLATVDGRIAAAVILGSLLLWVSRRIYACQEREKLAFPYLMWVVALATFVPPMANAYHLVCFPLAALAVCSRRDPVLCRAALAALALWWQPFFLPLGGKVLVVIKTGALASIGVSLVCRAREIDASVDSHH